MDRVFRPLGLVVGLLALVLSQCGLAPPPDRPPLEPRLETVTIHDSAYGRPRTFWVALPSGYDPRARTPYPLVIAFDGRDYLDTMNLPRVLDSLHAAGRTRGVVAVLIDDGDGALRIADLGNAPRLLRTIADQVLPLVRARWRVSRDPADVVATGSSAGGLAAAYLALERPDLVGNVFAQSGAFWRGADASNAPPYEWLTARARQRPRRRIRFVLEVGDQESRRVLGGQGPVFLDATRRFRDALVTKGYDVRYTEVPGGVHAPATWRPRLGAGLAATLPARP